MIKHCSPRPARKLPPWARQTSFVVGLVIVALFLVISFLPQLFTAYDPIAIDATARLKGPSAAHLFGTDNFGRDGVRPRIVRGEARPVHGRAGYADPVCDRRVAGPDRRLLRRLHRQPFDADHRRFDGAALHHPGHRHHDHPGAGASERVHRALGGWVDGLCQARARRGAGAQKQRVHSVRDHLRLHGRAPCC